MLDAAAHQPGRSPTDPLPAAHTHDMPRHAASGLAHRDVVRVIEDGRVGQIAGFYRRRTETVLVGFPSGETREFLRSEIDLL